MRGQERWVCFQNLNTKPCLVLAFLAKKGFLGGGGGGKRTGWPVTVAVTTMGKLCGTPVKAEKDEEVERAPLGAVSL